MERMLDVAQIPAKPSYAPGEVCLILGMSPRTFRRRANNFEPNDHNNPMDPATIDTFSIGGQKRVRHEEIIRYLIRNQTYQRLHGPEPQQRGLFGDVFGA